MKFPVVTSMFGDGGSAPGAGAGARCDGTGLRPDGEGRAMPWLAHAHGSGRPRRFRLLASRGGRAVGPLAAASVLVCAWAGSTVTLARAQGTADWPAYLHDKGHSSFNAAATSIGTGNVAHLQPVWQWFDPPDARSKIRVVTLRALTKARSNSAVWRMGMN